MNVFWTTEQIAGLASTIHLLKTSRSFALAEKWLTVGQNEKVIWGIFPLSTGKPPIHTCVKLDNLNFLCTCASRSFPCAHGIGLLQLKRDQPALFSTARMPEWVSTWEQDLQKRIDSQQRPTTAVPPLHQQQKRVASIRAGLSELELWLHDLVRNGLAATRYKPKEYWFRMADRMVDAKVNELAVELRLMAALPTDDAVWAETILRRIGRFTLLIEGFCHFDSLPPKVRADLQTAVGWLPKEFIAGSDIHDHWHIVGQQTELLGQRQVRHTWLWGTQCSRAAQIIQISSGQRQLDHSLVTGTVVEAKLRFYLSAAPLPAQFTERFGQHQPDNPVIGYPSIQAAFTDFNQALALNPWLKQFPVLLTAVPVYNGTHWQLQDENGANLLLPTHYKGKVLWDLMGLTGHIGSSNEMFVPAQVKP